MSSGKPILVVENLVKRFNHTAAVDGVSFEVSEGEVFGFLGPNGAGKSTTISMIAGLLRPSSGRILVDGHDLAAEPMAAREVLGYIPQDIALYPNLSALENLVFWGQMYGLGGPELRRRAWKVLSIVGLADRAKERVGTFSGGMKRRINIGCGLMHNPKLVLMDEPTVGIDPQSRNNILETVKELNAAGLTVIYTSHYMEEVEFLCDRLAIMDHGKVIASGSIGQIRRLAGDDDELTIKVDEKVPAPVLELIHSFQGVREVTDPDHTVRILAGSGRTVLAHAITAIAAAGVNVRSVSVREPDLESVFLHLTGKALRD